MMFTSAQLLDKVNHYITHLTYSRRPKGLYDPVEYVLSLGGKRIRPVFMLSTYNIYKENVDEILSSAAGIEMYHNYTLLHDDLMDRADLRRGKPTVHKVWNDNTAILSGDTMLVLAYQLMSRCDERYLKSSLDLFSRTAIEVGEGQQFDMEFETRWDVTEEEYIEMIRLKTSVLLAAALQMGALLAGASQEDQQLIYDLGISVGLAFQLQDDFLDVYGDTKTFGKKIGGDILCNKKTYMLINALRLANEEQRAELNRWIAAEQFDPQEKIQAVTALYDAIGIKELCLRKIDSYFEEAMKAFDRWAVPAERKEILRAEVLSLMNRKS
jgi:geranylgeranyl diphosphate synthase type II